MYPPPIPSYGCENGPVTSNLEVCSPMKVCYSGQFLFVFQFVISGFEKNIRVCYRSLNTPTRIHEGKQFYSWLFFFGQTRVGYGGQALQGLFTWMWGTRGRWGDHMRDYMDRRVTPAKRFASPAWGPPPLCKQALRLSKQRRNTGVKTGKQGVILNRQISALLTTSLRNQVIQNLVEETGYESRQSLKLKTTVLQIMLEAP